MILGDVMGSWAAASVIACIVVFIIIAIISLIIGRSDW